MQPQPEPYDMTQPPPAPPAPKTKRGRTILVALVTGAVAFGIGVAAGGTDTPTTGPGTGTTPAACTDALDAADDLFVLAGDGLTQSSVALGLAGEGIEAAVVWDAARLENITDDMLALGAEMESTGVEMGATRAAYDQATEQCRN
jgi:hypothetical protein